MWSRDAAQWLAVLALLAGCRRDMYNQPYERPLRAEDFFADGSSARKPPRGSVVHAVGMAKGPVATEEAARPVEANGLPRGASEGEARRILLRGQERYGIYCSPCHGLTGSGNGMIVQRGFKRPPSFHIDRLRQESASYFVDVLVNGLGRMPSYAAQVAPEDRWAIAAYIGALQLSQSAGFSDLAPEDAERIEALQ